MCQTHLSRNLGYIEVIFISIQKFSISFTIPCAEVKISVQKMIVKKKEKTKEGHFRRSRFTARHFFPMGKAFFSYANGQKHRKQLDDKENNFPFIG